MSTPDGFRRMHYHIFSFTAESIKSVSAHWKSGVCTTGGGSHPAFASNAYGSLCTGGDRCNQCVLLLFSAASVCACVCTCPGAMAPPCSRANRQLRAEVRTAPAVRPGCHTRLGSRTSHRNFSDSSWKCLEECGERENMETQQEQRNAFLLLHVATSKPL